MTSLHDSFAVSRPFTECVDRYRFEMLTAFEAFFIYGKSACNVHLFRIGIALTSRVYRDLLGN